MNRRAVIGYVGLGTVGFGVVAGNAAAAQSTRPGVVIQTFLKAVENRRADLGRFVVLNRFPMDRAGIQVGIFTHAVLHETVDDPDCDFVMEVGYVDPGGYSGTVVEVFGAIRRADSTVLADGRGLSDLGVILGERSYRTFGTA